METYCGIDCCKECECINDKTCSGCKETSGKPCGGSCVAAEYVMRDGTEAYSKFKNDTISEINALGIDGLHIEDLNLLNGAYINLEYENKSGEKFRMLDDKRIYFANQVERKDSERCYGIAADESMILVCEYGCNGSEPEIVLYKRR